jgi:osmoprotectant transport system permease protein
VTPGEPLVRWEWIGSHLDEIAMRLGQHVLLTVIAVGVGFAIAFALALASLRWRRVYAPATAVTGILYTIPSLGLFALLIPFTGLSVLTAEIGLVGYTLLILLRNIVAGIRSVPSEVTEAAVGVGHTAPQLFLRVELPVALPVIIAGVRIATVTTIGLVTVSAIIGLGGMGYFILQGMQQFFSTPLIVGAALSIALAVVADATLVAAERALVPWARAR